MTSHRVPLALALVALALASPVARGGPTIIRDEMLQDTSITPSLGRGYSIATNTYQSLCLIDVVATKPSYDFDYSFQELTQDQITKGTATVNGTGNSGAGSGSWGQFNISWEWRDKLSLAEASQSETHYHHMLVTININVYYNSVDEAQSRLSPAATKILQSKDLPGFFDACGMYYVRSISRQAQVTSLFTYSNQSSRRDVAFDHHLTMQVRQFSVHDDSMQASTYRASEDVVDRSSTRTNASNLQITTTARGLGKSESADLISYDLPTFRASVKNAFRSTQPQSVGRITAIEVSPWVENTEFQAINKLEPLLVPVVDADGNPVYDMSDLSKIPPPFKMKTVMPYEQKRTLQVNAEFLAEIDRAARAKLNVYFLSKRCRATINLDYMQESGDGVLKFRMEPGPAGGASESVGKTVRVWSNRRPNEWMPLEGLSNVLAPNKLQQIWMEYDAFMYGGTGDDDAEAEKDPVGRAQLAKAMILSAKPGDAFPKNVFPGAGRCISELFAAGITARSYRSILACRRVEEGFPVMSSSVVVDYCMPRFTDGQGN